jgi:hypothetical protein
MNPTTTLDVRNCRCGQDHVDLPLGELLTPREVVDPRDRRRMILARYIAHCPVAGYAIYAEAPKEGGETVQEKKTTQPGTNESGTETEKPSERITGKTTEKTSEKTTEVEDETGKDEKTTDDDKGSD